MYARGERVRLTVDVYARHFPALRQGAEGVVFGVARRGRDHLLHVVFPGAGRRTIPAAYLAPVSNPAQAAQGVRPAVLVVGPRGGYRSLTYERQGETVTVTDRDAIRAHLEQLRQAGVPIREERAS